MNLQQLLTIASLMLSFARSLNEAEAVSPDRGQEQEADLERQRREWTELLTIAKQALR